MVRTDGKPLYKTLAYTSKILTRYEFQFGEDPYFIPRQVSRTSFLSKCTRYFDLGILWE